EVTFNLLGSHDTTRILTFANGNEDRFKLAYLFMFTQSGCPCIYYGDEIGMEGKQSPESEGQRKCMEWDKEKQNQGILDFMKKIIYLRKQTKAFKSTNNDWIIADNDTGVIIFKKEDVTIIMNNNENANNIKLPIYLQNKEVLDLFSKEKIILQDEINIKSYGYLIIK
ncbi:MAG: alpha-amylase family glycosyl hydrolase, partial [Romboutsia sp.]|uniref:alpha-amylase family glycosyl hydrolase n=1 Tax=Romboutsia sp. TaxID=1965302 RepID=UPI003F37BD39